MQSKRITADKSANTEVSPALNGMIHTSGRPLDAGVRFFMESRFNRDFSKVRVHTDRTAAESAQSLDAEAYTVRNDIVLNTGRYAPDTETGKALLSHELTHVLQQKTTGPASQAELAVGKPTDAAERQADTTANAVMSGVGKVPDHFLSSAPCIQRVCHAVNIGTPKGCDDDGPNFITGFPLFMFRGGCDEFESEEEEKLKGEIGELPASGPVEVHGYASMDGDPTFNENLSCARALKAKKILTSSGIVAGRISIIKHGPTPGPAEERRSVVLKSTASPVPDPAPDPAPDPTPGPAPGPAPTPPIITSRTVVYRPGSRARTKIGVGEKVRLKYSGDRTRWTTTAGRLISLLRPVAKRLRKRVTLIAPDTAQKVTVKAGKASKDFDVIAPDNVHMDRKGSLITHIKDTPELGMGTKPYLLPDTVNFNNVIYREMDVNAVATPGVYSCFNGAVGHCGAGGGGAPCEDVSCTRTVIAGKGTKVDAQDCAYSGSCAGAPPFVPGSMTFSIPYQYKIGDGGTYRQFTVVNQVHQLAADAATLTADKAGAHAQALVTDGSSEISGCP